MEPLRDTGDDQDESIKVKGRRIMKRGKSLRSEPDDEATPTTTEVRSPRTAEFRRYSMPEDSFNKSMGMDSETSESDDSDEMDAQKMPKKFTDFYDPKSFENLEGSAEVKELFQNILRYTPQKIELNFKLIPFIPDYIPAVGDIDAFLKVPRPDGAPDKVGLTVLDEPAAEQSEPAVLHLQLKSRTRSAGGPSKPSVVKRLEDASRQGRFIDKWIDDMGQLYRSKPPPAVQLTNKFPHPDVLLQQWLPEVEDKLMLEPTLNLLKLDCDLLQMIDVVCATLDIPVYGKNRIESLYTMFVLYTEIHNVDIQKIH